MDDQDNVYQGIWTNWSRGSATMGATLTTTRQKGDLLIAFTALFVPYVISRLWRIFCLASHQLYSTPSSRDTIHHQRQVILRNSSSADSGLASLLLVLLAWRHSPWKHFGRIFPVAFFAICFIIATTIAGGYSSQISTAVGNEVLLKGEHCAILSTDVRGQLNSTTEMLKTIHQTKSLDDAINYAQQCYSSTPSGVLDCDRFVVRNIATVIKDYAAGCPFASDICRDNATNIRLDTGHIDSNDYFGLNAPTNQRLSFRRVLSCAPLKTDGYSGTVTVFNKTYTSYNYGTILTGSSDDLVTQNFTYVVTDTETQYSQLGTTPAGLNYRLNAVVAAPVHGDFPLAASDFRPIPAVRNMNGDIIIVFLSGNGILFDKQSGDAWYRTRTYSRNLTSTGASGKTHAYQFDEAASPLGCVQQYQWCNPSYSGTSGCGPLASFSDAADGALPFFNLSKNQEIGEQDRAYLNSAVGARFLWMMIAQRSLDDVNGVVAQMGAKSLASQSSLSSGIQMNITDNQWQLDVTNWWNIMLSATQSVFVDTALRQSTRGLEPALISPANEYERQLCNSQKIRSTAYASFSLFGLLFTYVTGAIIIIVSYLLDPILSCLHKRRKYKQYEYIEWCTNQTMQLHRLAHSELECGEWSYCMDSVPITDTKVKLASLDISDLKAPKLLRRNSSHKTEPKPESNNQGDDSSGEEISQVSSDETLMAPESVHTAHSEETNIERGS
ncbi:hypothetical protein K449DRAFT_433887 [Hypoxylon sp. EC38]|nr:hypothetical protein K449DRAFT_433887 [Hypoxylon sp. EC38]